MKTLIIYDTCGEDNLQFTIVDGDYSHLNGIIINAFEEDPDREQLAVDFLFKPNGEFVHVLSQKVSLLEGKAWDKVSIITFIP